MDLKTLVLTEKDFDNLIEALKEAGKGKELASVISSTVMMMGVPEKHRAEMERTLRLQDSRNEERNKQKREDNDILIGKLLMFKRHIVGKDLLTDLNVTTKGDSNA